jgi:hypothetical protein
MMKEQVRELARYMTLLPKVGFSLQLIIEELAHIPVQIISINALALPIP